MYASNLETFQASIETPCSQTWAGRGRYYIHLHENDIRTCLVDQFVNKLRVPKVPKNLFGKQHVKSYRRTPLGRRLLQHIVRTGVKIVLRWLSQFRAQGWTLILDDMADLGAYNHPSSILKSAYGFIAIARTNSERRCSHSNASC